jgi:regulator of replication initiation timing
MDATTERSIEAHARTLAEVDRLKAELESVTTENEQLRQQERDLKHQFLEHFPEKSKEWVDWDLAEIIEDVIVHHPERAP